LLGALGDGGKSPWIADRELCEHFPVEGAADPLKPIDQSAVGDAVQFRGDPDPGDPKAAEISLAELAVLVVEREGREERIFAEF